MILVQSGPQAELCMPYWIKLQVQPNKSLTEKELIRASNVLVKAKAFMIRWYQRTEADMLPYRRTTLTLRQKNWAVFWLQWQWP